MFNLTQYNNQQVLVVKAYITTSGVTLLKGQPLCYQTVPESSTLGYGYDVQIPSSTNEGFLAGIVAPWEVGVQTPAAVDMLVPYRGFLAEVLLSNLVQVAIGDVLKLNYDVPTSTAVVATAGGGGLEKLTLDPGTIATSQAGSVALSAADANILAAIGVNVAKAMETLASATAAGVRTRTLKWVYFTS